MPYKFSVAEQMSVENACSEYSCFIYHNTNVPAISTLWTLVGREYCESSNLEGGLCYKAGHVSYRESTETKGRVRCLEVLSKEMH